MCHIRNHATSAIRVHFAPGAPREAYFEGLPVLGGLTEEERAQFFLRHDTFWL